MLTLIVFGAFCFTGGREIFTDDINKFIEQLNEAGVDPSTICGDYNSHIWLPFCEGVSQ